MKAKDKELTEEQWREANPLRLWLDNPWARGKLAELQSKLGVTRQAMFGWMWGKHTPSYGMLAKLKSATGITAEQWARWLKDRPGQGRHGSEQTCGAAAC